MVLKKETVGAAAILIAVLLAAVIWMVIDMTRDEGAPEPSEAWDGVYRGHGGTFKNTLAEIDTPDPSIVYHDGYYYMTFTHNGADIMVMRSRTLDFRDARRKVVWYPPVDTMYSANIWAPEIQYLQGKWYIYFAADNGVNDNHRMYVLEAASDDPLGEYVFKGQVTDDTNRWAIDGLALEHEGKLYFVWSGWEGEVNIQQNTYIAPMSDPLTISGPRVLLSEPTLAWERAGGPPYINEGQAILKKDGRVFLMYSGAGSWTPFYSIGTLLLEPGRDPLDPASWEKLEEPLMTMDDEAGVYGPGHNTFVKSPDGREDWIVYHATSGLYDGWSNRKARAQRITWTGDGMPQLGKPLSLDTAIVVPSGSGVLRAEHARADGEEFVFDDIPSTQETEIPLLLHYETDYVWKLIRLVKGMNEIRLSAQDSVGLAAIELPRYEAENAQASRSAVAEDNPFASGWGVARLEDRDAVAQWNSVHVPIEGTYKIRLAAANPSGRDATAELSVNGGDKVKLTIPATDRNAFAPIEFELPLSAGPNRLTLKRTSELVIVDYIDIWR